MENLLVTGASGFVGRAVVAQALKEGKLVTGLGRNRPELDIAFIECDLSDTARLESALADKSFTRILHLASLPGDTGDPQQMVRVNVNGCLNMLECARKIKVRRFVLASSISAYEWYPGTKFNPPDYMPVDENHPCRPKDIYSTTKRMQELLVQTYHHQYMLPTAVLRLTAIVGPQGRGGGHHRPGEEHDRVLAAALLVGLERLGRAEAVVERDELDLAAADSALFVECLEIRFLDPAVDAERRGWAAAAALPR